MSNISNYLRALTPINKGDDVRTVAKSDRINAIQGLLRSILNGEHITTNRNVIRKRLSSGLMSLEVNQASRFRGGGRGDFPWRIRVIDELGLGEVVKVSPGTINGLLPTNMFDDNLGAVSSGTMYVILQCQTDGVVPTSCNLLLTTNVPAPPGHNISMAPFSFEVLIGVTVNSIPFQIVDGLLQAIPQFLIQTTKPDPQPGSALYDYHYTWGITQT